MAGGFEVDVVGLDKAAVGVAYTLKAVATQKPSSIDADKSAFGHDGLASTVSDFCDRWEIGVANLAKDGSAVADRLAAAAVAYGKLEQVNSQSFNGIAKALDGPDPGVTP